MLTQKRLAKRGEGGFTLIELLIVVVILGILVAIVLFAIGGFTGTSANAACKTDIKQAQTAASAYYAQNGVWPPSYAALSSQYLQSLAATTSTAAGSSHYYISYSPVANAAPVVTGGYDTGGGFVGCS